MMVVRFNWLAIDILRVGAAFIVNLFFIKQKSTLKYISSLYLNHRFSTTRKVPAKKEPLADEAMVVEDKI